MDDNTLTPDDFADQLHAAFLHLVGLFNRPEPDAAMLAEAGVSLDRALFPLLSRLGLGRPLSVVELGHLAGKDHSTVSRQVAKLEALGLVRRVPSPDDARVRLLVPSEEGEVLLEKFRRTRREAVGRWFADWSAEDRAKLIELLHRMLAPTEAAMVGIAETGRLSPAEER